MQSFTSKNNIINQQKLQRMKKHVIAICSLGTVLIVTSAFVVKYSTGIAGKTGSPGESTCASCHYSGTGVTSTSITGNPAFTGNQYVPGQTYTVSVIVSSTALSNFGFDCEILNGTTSSAANSGNISAISGSSRILNSGSRTNATHIYTAAGTGSPSSTTFNFQWVAPLSGNAVIYAAGLAVNNDGSAGPGDLVKTATLSLTPNTNTNINEAIGFTAVNIYPNPSKDNLSIDYYLLKDGEVNISLYDLQGKELWQLVSGAQATGPHSSKYVYPAHLESGVYFLKLSLNHQEITQRLIIKQ